MDEEVTTRQHPKSGELYAVRIVDGTITEAYGPIHPRDSHTPLALEEMLANNSLDAGPDGAWLQAELDGAGEHHGRFGACTDDGEPLCFTCEQAALKAGQ